METRGEKKKGSGRKSGERGEISERRGGGKLGIRLSVHPYVRTYVRAESMFCKIQEVLGGREDGK